MTEHRPPKVLISGAGLGGLMLAIILERARIPYHIYERAPSVKPLGAALGLNANILPVFDQLGLLPELQKIAFPCTDLELCHETLRPIGAIDISGFKDNGIHLTNPLDPEKYPVLKDERCHFTTVIGHQKAHTWFTCSLPGNRISFIVAEQLDENTAKEIAFRNAEWTPESNEKMINEVRHFPFKHARSEAEANGEKLVLGDLIDSTRPESISKVFLEEKLFETWHDGRTVLIGDACHKMQPSAGQGAVNAMEDAVVLANCLYDISSGKEPVTAERIAEAFRDYREQRYPHAKFQVQNSKEMARLLNGQTWMERLVRTLIYNLPTWLVSQKYLKQAGCRQQIILMATAANTPDLEVYPQSHPNAI
ncbi:hypothetical protein BGZ65_001770 [Modicella reniformis]|uniref:FAD-binding domain-containing protein n=1 Tax=Modicella reniformis TaxID=1440133 RepID=A0A9P6SUH9_9FUNG|nr:hypothetical protein BGZ65_001770 [Modicella reniformis]